MLSMGKEGKYQSGYNAFPGDGRPSDWVSLVERQTI